MKLWCSFGKDHKPFDETHKEKQETTIKLSNENTVIQLNWMLEEPEELALYEANSQVA